MRQLPNILTTSRILLSPLFIFLFLRPDVTSKIMALALVIYSEVSDVLDGYIARKYNYISETGKLLDPLADSIFHFSVFLAFLSLGYAQIWMILIIFYRNVTITWLRRLAATRQRIISARLLGKIKTFVQAVTIFTIILLAIANCWTHVPHLRTISLGLMTLVTLITVYSLIGYLRDNWDVIRTMQG